MRPTDSDFRSALAGHRSRVERYQRGELSNDEFRPIRLSYGLYYQLNHTSHMQRIKLPGGLMTVAQADCLADIADEFGRGVAHVTTRQDVQMHWIPLDQVIPIYERLHAVGITTRGACADTVRNVTGCYHAGTLADEAFDVTPYVFAVHEYSLFHPLNLTLPRKFKVAFSSCAADCVQALINDLAFFPKQRGGTLGFSVHAGGGLGAQPFLAIPLCDFVPAQDVLVVTEAVLRFQHRAGERKNRHKARMKYVVKNLGAERFVAEVNAELATVERECGADLRRELQDVIDTFEVPAAVHAATAAPAARDEALASWMRTNVREQRQSGYFGIEIQLPLGDCTGAQLRGLARLAREHGNGTLRATNDQNLFLPWIAGSRLAAVHEGLGRLRLAEAGALHITDVTSCPGVDYCSLAVSRSMGMAVAIRKQLLADQGLVADLGVFRIKISGCPNSCGQHHIADIGLTGLSLKGADGLEHPHYSVLVGGSVGEGGSGLGHRLRGRYAESDVPRVVASLAGYYRSERRGTERFAAFVSRVGAQPLSDLADAAVTR